MRESNIYKALLKKAEETRTKGNFQFDLNMKNGDEVTIYLPGQKIVKDSDYESTDYSVLDDNNNVHHFETLADVAEWINENY